MKQAQTTNKSATATGDDAMVSQRKININTASKDELIALPKIGDERAQTLVDNRPFDSWDEINDLPGFDEGLVRDLQNGGGYLGEEDVEEW
jgi:DNA uptake protein ComE-like DNA-binding protein